MMTPEQVREALDFQSHVIAIAGAMQTASTTVVLRAAGPHCESIKEEMERFGAILDLLRTEAEAVGKAITDKIVAGVGGGIE